MIRVRVRLRVRTHVVGRLGSEMQVSASFQIISPRGSVRVRVRARTPSWGGGYLREGGNFGRGVVSGGVVSRGLSPRILYSATRIVVDEYLT